MNLILIVYGGPNTPLISFHFWTIWVFWTICFHAYLWESKIFNLVYNGKIQYGECANFWNWHLPTPRVATHVGTQLAEYCHIGSILPHSMKSGWILSYQIFFHFWWGKVKCFTTRVLSHLMNIVTFNELWKVTILPQLKCSDSWKQKFVWIKGKRKIKEISTHFVKLFVVLVTMMTWPARPVVSTEMFLLEFAGKLTWKNRCSKHCLLNHQLITVKQLNHEFVRNNQS